MYYTDTAYTNLILLRMSRRKPYLCTEQKPTRHIMGHGENGSPHKPSGRRAKEKAHPNNPNDNKRNNNS